MARNNALDFCRAPGAVLRRVWLSAYCDFVGLAGNDRKALHDALTKALGAVLVEQTFLDVETDRRFTEPAYVGAYWNLDSGFPDFEEFVRAYPIVMKYTPRVFKGE